MDYTNDSHEHLGEAAEFIGRVKGKAFNQEHQLSSEYKDGGSYEETAQSVAVAAHAHELLVVVALALQVDDLHLKHKEVEDESDEEGSSLISYN